jgi:hypothetical protein
MSQITEDIITDLLPLYYSKHASKDSIVLVEEYFAQNPEFASEHRPLLSLNTPKLDLPDELKALKTTRFYLKMRSLLFFLAILASLLPFSFGDVSWIEAEGVQWLWVETPEVAILSSIVAIVCWTLYALLRRNLRVTAL